ncbi:hypothetical protein NEFER03_1921 [Nematocida sp. LUAm3]|nr:hypothetical protein NEFER03_1921 [Nematocida sp. LUAm3]KAI5176177.1 hypothetical protein NEFER02_1991 [Nematocida sp. LUAm2]KAI5179271.1 hypothetical protein NEFER01_2123 [Nematocida sp. LUAm1]
MFTSMIHLSKEDQKVYKELMSLLVSSSKMNPLFLVCAFQMKKSTARGLSFSEKVLISMRYAFAANKVQSVTKERMFYSMTLLARDLIAHYVCLEGKQKESLQQEFLNIYNFVKIKAIVNLFSIKGAFFENLMERLFGVNIREILEACPERKSNSSDSPVQVPGGRVEDKTDEELNHLFLEYEANPQKIANGQRTKEWLVAKELYRRSLLSAKKENRTIEEILFIFRLDKACRDLSPSALIHCGIIGKIKDIRETWITHLIDELEQEKSDTKMKEVLSAIQKYYFMPVLDALIERMQKDKPEEYKDIENILIDLRDTLGEIRNASLSLQSNEELKEAMFQEQCQMDRKLVRALIADHANAQAEMITQAKREISSINKTLLAQKLCPNNSKILQEMTRGEGEIRKMIKKCLGFWRRVKGYPEREEVVVSIISVVDAEEPTQEKPSVSPKDLPVDAAPQDASDATISHEVSSEDPIHTTMHTSIHNTMHTPSLILPSNEEQTNTKCTSPEHIEEGIEEDVKEGKDEGIEEGKDEEIEEETQNKKETSTPLFCSPETDQTDSLLVSLKEESPVQASTSTAEKRKPLSSLPIGGVTGGMGGIGAIPKEEICSDERCKIHYVEKNNANFFSDVLISVDPLKRPSALEEYKALFAGLRYCCLYECELTQEMKQMIHHEKKLFSVKPLFDSEFSDTLRKEPERVHRQLLYKEAHKSLALGEGKNTLIKEWPVQKKIQEVLFFLRECAIKQKVASEKAKKQKEIKDIKEKRKNRSIFSKTVSSVKKFIRKLKGKEVPSLSEEELLQRWEREYIIEQRASLSFTKHPSEGIAPGFFSVCEALCTALDASTGGVFRESPRSVDVKQRYIEYIDEGKPVDIEEVKKNPDELKALSIVFNRYIRAFNGGIISGDLYSALSQLVSLENPTEIDYPLGQVLLCTMDPNSIWLLKHVVYTVEQVSTFQSNNLMSYNSIVNMVAPNLLSNDVTFSLETPGIAIEMTHALFSAVRNTLFLEKPSQ